jgi:hypothetical protein
MRKVGGIVVLAVAAMALARPACAEPDGVNTDQAALKRAVFVQTPRKSERSALTAATQVLQVAPASGAAAIDPPFRDPVFSGSALDSLHLLAPDRLVEGQGLVHWSTSEVELPQGSSPAVDSLRLSLGGVARAPGGEPLAGPGGLLEPENQAFDLRYTRGWPSALALNSGRYGIDFSPHAGFGLSTGGPSAEAGAMVRLGANLQGRLADGLSGLGVRETARPAFDNQGRWYFYAAASGRAFDLNMARDPTTDGQRLGWTADSPMGATVSDAQAGVAWRRGLLQATFGYVHREIRANPEMVARIGPSSFSDSMVALSFNIRPK